MPVTGASVGVCVGVSTGASITTGVSAGASVASGVTVSSGEAGTVGSTVGSGVGSASTFRRKEMLSTVASSMVPLVGTAYTVSVYVWSSLKREASRLAPLSFSPMDSLWSTALPSASRMT